MNKKSKELSKNNYYRIIITKDEEIGYFIAEVPSLAPCITFGETIDEAMKMAYEAIEAVIESRIANGFEIQDNSQEIRNSKKPIEMFLPIGSFYKNILSKV
jgi:antitoxin HicB